MPARPLADTGPVNPVTPLMRSHAGHEVPRGLSNQTTFSDITPEQKRRKKGPKPLSLERAVAPNVQARLNQGCARHHYTSTWNGDMRVQLKRKHLPGQGVKERRQAWPSAAQQSNGHSHGWKLRLAMVISTPNHSAQLAKDQNTE